MANVSKEEILRSSGFGNRIGFGTRPALLVVDMQVGFTDPEKSPLAGNLSSQVGAIAELLPIVRRRKWPVIFTATGYDPHGQADAGLWVRKAPNLRLLKRGSDLVEIDPRLAVEPGDMVITKQYASAFFATNLASSMTALAVDTLLVTGCTTSGCVRASVVDAVSHGFRPIVVVEGVGDRAQEPHDASLFDMDNKYGDVVRLEAAREFLLRLPANDRPPS
jgi:nicotinamidase-related amidase